LAEQPPEHESLRETAARILRGDPVPEANGSFWSRLELNEILVFITGELIALPFAFNGADAFMKGDFRHGFLAYAIALPCAIGGLTFHFWKKWIGETARVWIPILLIPIALVSAFIFVLGPDIYRRATEPHEIYVERLHVDGPVIRQAAKSLPSDVAKIASLEAALKKALHGPPTQSPSRPAADTKSAGAPVAAAPAKPHVETPAVAGEASPGVDRTLAASAIPTSVQLQINSPNEAPVWIGGENIDDVDWFFPVEAVTKQCPDKSVTSSTSPFGDISSSFSTPPACSSSSILAPQTYVETRNSWVFFILFKKPISYSDIKIDAHGAGLPKWESVYKTKNFAVIWIHGDPPPMILDIKAVK
jgi:hypothetical protein